jgi:hypothetical protein
MTNHVHLALLIDADSYLLELESFP